jgi:hypothetical protein
MEEQHIADDQSHYEISLTAGQAFVAFILLLASLGSAFAFGMMIGRGQADERLVVRRDSPVVTEASALPKKSEGRIVELGVADEEFTQPETEGEPVADAAAPQVIEEPALGEIPSAEPPAQTTTAAALVVPPQTIEAVHYAQLLSTLDQKTAEALAVKLINGGFKNAYVERGASDKGPVFRVRVRFDSEPEARAAESKLKTYSSEVWITSR